MKQRFHTLDDAANVLNTTVYALLQAAEAGELTLALPTHGKYLFRFCPRERGKYYPDMQFMSCDCIPVPPHTISVLLANQLTTEPEPAIFSRVELPDKSGSWIEFWHIDDFFNLDIPASNSGLFIRLSESSLRITDAELERVAAGREQDDLFDLVGPDSRRLELSGIRQGIERLTYMVATEQADPAHSGAQEQSQTGEQAEILRKRQAFIAELAGIWPSIEDDLSDSVRNGLTETAKAKKHGYWKVGPALNWAAERGKLHKAKADAFIRANGESEISALVRAMLDSK